jgi:hypothetical protein
MFQPFALVVANTTSTSQPDSPTDDKERVNIFSSTKRTETYPLSLITAHGIGRRS